MQAPGFWDDQERAARVSAEHAAVSRRLETFRSLERTSRTSTRSRRWRPRTSRSRPSSTSSASIESAARGARGGAPVQRRVRRRRRGRDRERRRRRDRLPGLGGDAAAHGDALGRAARDEGRAEGGLARGRRPASSRPRSSPAGRTPTGSSQPRRASTGWCASRRSTRSRAATPPSPGWRWRRWWRTPVDVEIEPDDLQIDTYRAPARAAST